MSAAVSSGERGVEPVLSTAQIRALEARYADANLMRRAGKAAADFLMQRTTRDARIVLFAGPGNNGGDALACAAELAAAGYVPQLILLGDPEKLPADAAQAWRRVAELNTSAASTGFAPSPPEGEGRGEGDSGMSRDHSSSSDVPPLPQPLSLQGRGEQIVVSRETPSTISADWIVDGLFGIGLKRPLDGAFSDAVRVIAETRRAGATVFSLDAPSGIDADTGALVGDTAVAADFTLTFLSLKPGLLTGPALNFLGALHCDSLGTARDASTPLATAVNRDYIDAAFSPRAANAHKGSQGTCVIIGGADGMLGAATLASRAAMRCGAGKVKVGWLASTAPTLDANMPEIMMGTASDLVASENTAIVIGCGLSVSGAAVRVLTTALQRDTPMVVDADALNLIAQSAELATLMQRRTASTVITPHPAEAARLLGCSTADVQRDRLRAARDLAKGYRCVAVLKGAGTVVCDGLTHTALSINRTGNALLATAGTGDVLAGMIGALLAQGFDVATAAHLGVCMHGAAADQLAASGVRRMVASDLFEPLARL